MKKIKLMFAMAAVAAMFASCTTIQRNAVVVNDMKNRVYQHPLVAELEAKPRAELTMKKRELRGVMDPKAYITAELLKKNNADVLLEMRTTVVRRGLMHRLVSMTVSGVPASYKNFHSSTEQDLRLFLNPTSNNGQINPILNESTPHKKLGAGLLK